MQGEARVDEGEFGFSPIERNAPDSLLSILSILDSLDSLVPTHQASGERTHALTHPELFRLVRHAPSASRITSPRPTKLSTQRGPHRGPHDQGHIALIETKTKTKSEGPASTNEPHPFFPLARPSIWNTAILVTSTTTPRLLWGQTSKG